jgi:hypothetical protein
MLKVALESREGRTQIFYWFSKFISSVDSVEDAAYLGHPLTSKTDENVDKMNELVLEKRRIAIHEVSKPVGNLISVISEEF